MADDFIEETDFSDDKGTTLIVRRTTSGVYFILGVDGECYPSIGCCDADYLHDIAKTIDLYASKLDGTADILTDNLITEMRSS